MNVILLTTLLLAMNFTFAANPNPTEREPELEEITVTGSRIPRDEYTSLAPMQTVDINLARDLGILGATQLLQQTNQGAGRQADYSVLAFPLPKSGPGTTEINLRGLGSERSLLLLNGRRMSPAGVTGAPTAPDVSLIPGIMIERVEMLLDGASSVYGSDALAGVVNVIMREPVDGFEIKASATQPQRPGGQERNLGVMWGHTSDTWRLGIGAEYYEQKLVRLGDRRYTRECARFLYEDERGERLPGLFQALVPGTSERPCYLSTGNRLALPIAFGNVWYTPGTSNIGIPNFSETLVPAQFAPLNPAIVPTDADGDGTPDYGLIDADGNGLGEVDLQSPLYNLNGANGFASLSAGHERASLFANAELSLENGHLAYAEVLYSSRSIDPDQVPLTPFLFSADVPVDHPLNPCNQAQPNGVNCLGFFGVNFGSLPVSPWIWVKEDRTDYELGMTQWRLVTGLRGDLPVSMARLKDWHFDIFVSHSDSLGDMRYQGIDVGKLDHALANTSLGPNGELVCSPDCVPVDLFAPSLYQPGGGTFATPAERDYLFVPALVDTRFRQTLASAVLQGKWFDLPWNGEPVPGVVGLEWRRDQVHTEPNETLQQGNLFQSFTDRGADGSRHISEVFLEAEATLIRDRPLVEEWLVNLSARWTHESLYGSHTTYSIKTLYTPTPSIMVRATYGTSYRAPNAQEQFLEGAGDFAFLNDPCVVPFEARVVPLDPSTPFGYDPAFDERASTTLDNCRADGIDPLALGLAPGEDDNFYLVDVLRRGGDKLAIEIDPESSTSWTAGVIVEPPLPAGYAFRLVTTYFEIDVEDSIASLDAEQVLADCYDANRTGNQGFCRLIKRGADQRIELVDVSFVNRDQLISRGIDYSGHFGVETSLGSWPINLAVDLKLTHMLEKRTSFFGLTSEDRAGTPEVAEWKGELAFKANSNDLGFAWRANFISGEEDTQLPYDDYIPCRYNTLLCRPIVTTDDYWQHSVSLSWKPDDWRFTLGVANIFDEAPPQIDDAAETYTLQNVPRGVGYDLTGRRWVASVTHRF